jgi:hypothetical protein
MPAPGVLKVGFLACGKRQPINLVIPHRRTRVAQLAGLARVVRDFHKYKILPWQHPHLEFQQKSSKKRQIAIPEFAPAQIALHTPVNELHSIEIKAHANSFFLLTQNLEGVKP